MTKLIDENLVSMSKACDCFPMGRVSRACLERWIRKGVRNGIKLETVAIGWRRYTSREAIQRFIESMNAETIQQAPLVKKHSEKDLEERKRKLGI